MDDKLNAYEEALRKIISIREHPEIECPEMVDKPGAMLNYMYQQAADAIYGKSDLYPG